MATTLFQDIEQEGEDLRFLNGDFNIAPSDQQHIEDIICSFPGEWKSSPQVGVGIGAYFASTGKEQEISRKVIVQLKADGYTVEKPEISLPSTGNMKINPNAIRQ